MDSLFDPLILFPWRNPQIRSKDLLGAIQASFGLPAYRLFNAIGQCDEGCLNVLEI
jgi:hypothetical protein